MLGVRTQARIAVSNHHAHGASQLVSARSARQLRLARPDDRQVAAIEGVLASAGERARTAYDTRQRWADRVRAGLAAVLEYLEQEPQLARLCVVQSAAAGPA
jgi:hypothetical protein